MRCLFCNIFPDRVHVFELIPQQRQQPFLNLVSLLNCAAAAAKPVIHILFSSSQSVVVVVFLAFEYIAADKKNVMWTHKQEEVEDDKDQPASPDHHHHQEMCGRHNSKIIIPQFLQTLQRRKGNARTKRRGITS